MKLQDPKRRINLIIVNPSLKYKKLSSLLVYLLLLIFILNSIICIYFNKLCVFTLILFGIVFLYNLILPLVKKQFMVNGLVGLSTSEILINEEEKIDFDEVSYLEFKFSSVKGESYPEAIFGVNILGVQNGINNKLKILKKDGSSYQFNILLTDEFQLNWIKTIFKILESNNIKAKVI